MIGIRCLFLFLLILASDLMGQSQWTWRNPLPQGNALRSVAWCGDRFVAVGEAGTILVSTDGMSWKNHSVDTSALLQSVACSGNHFVAVGHNGKIFTSPDAEVWTARISGGDFGLNSVIWAGNMWVTVGGGVILTSPDGIVWNNALSSDPQNSYLLISVAWNGEILVATGGMGDILTSSDGKNWTNRSLEETYGISSLIWTGTTFAAVGRNGIHSIDGSEFLTSADGLAWERQPIEISERVSFPSSDNNLIWDGKRYMIGGSRTISTSPDGVNWSVRQVNTRFPIYSLAWSGSRYVAVGAWGDILVSQDGEDWTLLTQTKGWKFRDITWAGDKFVAVGEESTILTSGDGVVWQPISQTFDSSLVISTVLWTGSRLVAFADNNIAMTSPDGRSWTLHEYSPEPDAIRKAVWTGNGIAAASANGIYFSKEGADWTFKPFPSRMLLPTLAWNGSRFVVADMGRVLVSSNGDSWNSQSLDSSFLPRDIAWSGSRFVMVGGGGIFTSPDGNSWIRPSAENKEFFTNVTWIGTHFLAVDQEGYLYQSADGLAWTRKYVGALGITGIGYNDNLLILTNYYGAILSSPRGLLTNAVLPKVKRSFSSNRTMNPWINTLPLMYSIDGRLMERVNLRGRARMGFGRIE